MAWLEERNGQFHVCFRIGPQKFKKSLRTTDRRHADRLAARVEENLTLVERGRLVIPEDADIPTFLLSDGIIQQVPDPKQPKTLSHIFADYLAHIPDGAMEANSLATARIHMNHFERLLGKRFILKTLTRHSLQEYVNRRSQEKGARGNVSPTTIRKELTTFSAVWSFAAGTGFVNGSFPNRPTLQFPKAAQKPPFQTFAEIERQIQRGGLTPDEEEELWNSLFLTLPEVDDLLRSVKEHARHSFLYPMVLVAAHTGARRSELLRSQLTDLDLDGGVLILREKKRAKGRYTTRSVPISSQLQSVLSAWIEEHPGGRETFSLSGMPLTRNQAHDHFKRTLKGKWANIRGWHVLRHSFASNCAAGGVDQRIINKWMGHQTEAMVQRYRHLLPDQQQAAIESVFGR